MAVGFGHATSQILFLRVRTCLFLCYQIPIDSLPSSCPHLAPLTNFYQAKLWYCFPEIFVGMCRYAATRSTVMPSFQDCLEAFAA